MQKFQPEYLAKEAERLRKEPVLMYALDQIRSEALRTLTTVDPNDRTAILREQMRHAAVDHLLAILDGYVAAVDEDRLGIGAPV